jgi:hypothetical protein
MTQMSETDSAWKVEGMKTNWLLQEFRFYSFLTCGKATGRLN